MGDKVKVTQMLSCGPKISQAEVAKKCGCSQSQVSQANKNMVLILQQLESKLNPNNKWKREGKEVATEDALYCWFVNARSKALPLPGPVLMEESKSLADNP